MSLQIAIIGLGQIGTSFGLALAAHTDLVTRVGHDRQSAVAHQAEKLGAVDRTDINLPSSVRNADLILLCLPLDQIAETLELIAQDLKEGAVVMDTGPLKEVVADWAKKALPSGRHYVGLLPLINPIYLDEASSGQQAAHADLFENGVIAISSPPHTDSDAIKLAANLARMVGSSPLFADQAEIDGLMASTLILPQILAAALLNATIDQPGWREGRKFAGRTYAGASSPVTLSGGSGSISTAILSNKENVLRLVNNVMVELQQLRGMLDDQDDDGLEEFLARAYHKGTRWKEERLKADWENEQAVAVEKRGILSQFIGANLRPRPKPKSKL